MSKVNELEIKTQRRIIDKVFCNNVLNYTYLGNYKERENNPNVEEDLLLKFLLKKYDKLIAKRAVQEFASLAYNETKSIYEVNKEIYNLLKYGKGLNISIDKKTEQVYYIDFENFENNDFYIAEEVTINGNSEKRPDIVVYINGIAIAVIELKRSTVSINEGIRQNLDNQKSEFIERFFSTIQLVIAGNDSEGLRYGTLKTPAKYYLNWQEDTQAIGKLHAKVNSMIDRNNLLIDQQLVSIFEKERLLDIINNYIIYDGGIKKVPRYNQYFGVTNLREFVKKHEGGVFWHTQGSGKSLSMVIITKWILSNMDDSRVVIFTDRKELDKQIKDVFINTGEVNIHRARSSSDLLQSLNSYEAGNLICSLIHKVGTSAEKDSDKAYAEYIKELEKYKATIFDAKGDIFVLVDECHRSQAGLLHKEMKRLLPKATFLGFTGTPLLKTKKQTTMKQFGKYIHTYKFNQAVKDRVICDLSYEARSVDQKITNPKKIDEWFDLKTSGLNEFAKRRLKERWGTLQSITSSRCRLEEIAKEIIFDFEKIPRLHDGKGTAILVANSIYEACRYWEIFQKLDFKKCAIISSYSPNIKFIRGEEDGEFTFSDKQKIFEIYTKMWNKEKYPKLRSDNENDSHENCFEDDAIYNFINNPSEMKLLIVVERLLTGFDAPSASYLYIDKHLENHGLFQAICRVNRLDDDTKDLGYIVDYKDLFKSIESAVTDYTTGAFENFDSDDITGLIKNRLDFAKERLIKSLNNVKTLCEQVENPKNAVDFIHYFVANELSIEESYKDTEPKRLEFYDAVSNLILAYANIADEMTKAGYTKEEATKIKSEVKFYTDAKDIIIKSAGDYIELKNYDSSMRYMIDNYVYAEESEFKITLEKDTLLSVIESKGIDEATKTLPEKIKKDKKALTLSIEANIASTIIKNEYLNPRYYSKMSELLQELVQVNKEQALDYQEYIKQLVELVKKVKSPDKTGEYPKSINSVRLRGLYDILDKDEIKTHKIYKTMNESIPYDFMDTKMKQRDAKMCIYELIENDNLTEEIFNLWKNTREY